MHIDFIGKDAIIETPEVAFTYQVSENPREFDNIRGNTQSLDWNNHENYYGDYIVYPFGTNNDLPAIIKDVVQNNYIAPGLLNRKTELLWGSGPKLYKEVYEGNRPVREWTADTEIQKWLDSWDYENYLLTAATDYQHLQGVFTRFELNRGARINRPAIAELHTLSPDKARLASIRAERKRKPSHVIVTDWKFNHASHIEDAKVYSLFDYRNPFSKENSVLYSSKYTFCTDYYTVPEIYGSLEWLNRSTAVPLIFKALSKNSINLKYHIISPQKFWNEAEDKIKENCRVKTIEYKDTMLLEYQKEFLRKMAKVLSGEDNYGKYLHTTKILTVDGTNLVEHGWEIKVIDQNIKDFVEAQIKISQRADRAVSSGISLHSALGNMSETGKVDSGSEQHYALLSYLNTGIDIQEMVICKAINYAIKANFPTKDLKIGFYHNVPEKQEDVSPKDRSANNGPLNAK